MIAPANSPQPVQKTKIELMAGVAIAGLVLLLLLSFAAEGRALRQAKRPEMLIDARATEMPHLGDEPERAPAEEEARTQ